MRGQKKMTKKPPIMRDSLLFDWKFGVRIEYEVYIVNKNDIPRIECIYKLRNRYDEVIKTNYVFTTVNVIVACRLWNEIEKEPFPKHILSWLDRNKEEWLPTGC